MTKKTPDKIYLLVADPDPEWGVLWSPDEINETDIEYVRADLVAEKDAEIERLRMAGRKMREDLIGEGLPNCDGVKEWQKADPL